MADKSMTVCIKWTDDYQMAVKIQWTGDKLMVVCTQRMGDYPMVVKIQRTTGKLMAECIQQTRVNPRARIRHSYTLAFVENRGCTDSTQTGNDEGRSTLGNVFRRLGRDT